MPPQLLLATNNSGKLAEYGVLLEGCGWEVVTPRDLGLEIEVAETGETYEANATMKALRGAEASGLVTLAAATLSPPEADGRQRWLVVGGILAGAPNESYAIRLHDYASGEVVASQTFDGSHELACPNQTYDLPLDHNIDGDELRAFLAPLVGSE